MSFYVSSCQWTTQFLSLETSVWLVQQKVQDKQKPRLAPTATWPRKWWAQEVATPRKLMFTALVSQRQVQRRFLDEVGKNLSAQRHDPAWPFLVHVGCSNHWAMERGTSKLVHFIQVASSLFVFRFKKRLRRRLHFTEFNQNCSLVVASLARSRPCKVTRRVIWG